MTLLAFGLNHTTAPLEVREKVTFNGEVLPNALTELRHQPGVDEAAIVSTCNRTEIYCSLEPQAQQNPVAWFSHYHGFELTDLEPFLYTHPGAGAVKHILRVASGLDSMVLGEPQVLGQLKTAYHAALNSGSAGQLLTRLFQHSFNVAKQIRSNTAIGSHPVSVAFAAVRLARQIFGELSDKTVMLIGAGETIELAAKHLRECGLKRMIIANRTLERSQHLATEFSGYAISLPDVLEHLDEADIIITSTASQGWILSRDAIRKAVKKRKHRPMFVVDIAVPRDIEPSAGELDDVYLYTVDDLKDVIDENMRSRQEAAKQAEEIIDTQVVHFMDWLNSLHAVNTIRAIREQASAIQQQTLIAALKKLQGGGDPDKIMRELAHSLTNKLIHSPSSCLRNADSEQRDALLQAAQRLFDLTTDTSTSDKDR